MSSLLERNARTIVCISLTKTDWEVCGYRNKCQTATLPFPDGTMNLPENTCLYCCSGEFVRVAIYSTNGKAILNINE